MRTSVHEVCVCGSLFILLCTVTKKYADQIYQMGGEGIMLRKPNSEYENGISYSLAKLKVSVIIVYECNQIHQIICSNFFLYKKKRDSEAKILCVGKYQYQILL